MRQGFVKIAAATPDIKVADTFHNQEEICRMMEEGAGAGAKIIVFPELCITGYTCGDLFGQEVLLKNARAALRYIAENTGDLDCLALIGMPLQRDGKLYNVAAVLSRGEVLGIVPKTYLPNYGEFYEMRHFTPGNEEPVLMELFGREVPFGTNLLFACEGMPELVVAAEICEDVWAGSPPSISHAMAGATVIGNCSASDEGTGKDIYRKQLINGQSARLVCGYAYANAGDGESTTDLVFGGHNIISENGILLAESRRFQNGIVYAEVDVQRLVAERRRMTTFRMTGKEQYVVVPFQLHIEETKLTRAISPAPFVPQDEADCNHRFEEILSIQAMGLKKRLEHTGCRHAVVGISGGLDSTLALLVTVRAFDLLHIPRSGIRAVTMPCFGTTDRTYHNAVELIRRLRVSFMEVDIKEAVTLHFQDIGHDPEVHDVTYENGQARERTQVLMDIANQCGGLVIGTGDMSELALGWATYNGDHMSMYGVNASVPKTLVRYLVGHCARTSDDDDLKKVLLDILDTPVSPELLPPEDGVISQKTEDLVGPYELHDFYLYYVMRFGFEPSKIYRLAKIAFEGIYQEEMILKWMKIFYRRFFSQQFKRSCMPDGPKVGSVALSPRGDLRMPSDACAAVWLEDLERIGE